ncbi:Peptidase M24A, methionine aminopeptidase, subfamily 1 [Candidatus Magnetoovum chiemensis]|nr:Peptidase M24A, methionine aminopeptidase, subfamily 1 [Candidatus Magnetoovum chiemensis]
MIIIKTSDEIKKMAQASRIVSIVLKELENYIKPGITTKDIESFADGIVAKEGGKSAFKNYRGYPANLCASVNNEIVHGIPSKKKILKEGDIIGIDLGVVYKGYIGDAAKTYPVGKIAEKASRLIKITKESLLRGIEMARPNKRVSDISNAIQTYVEANGYSVVRNFVGHGVGKDLHEEPQIPNFGLPNKGPRLKEGMALAIEPMVNEGGYDVNILNDGWTAVTADGSLSAHFEHTVIVTKNDPLILTKHD